MFVDAIVTVDHGVWKGRSIRLIMANTDTINLNIMVSTMFRLLRFPMSVACTYLPYSTPL